MRLISQMRATGCRIALEDFGNGLTSFAYLRTLAVDFVKIGGLGISTIAEEVESDAALAKLQALGWPMRRGMPWRHRNRWRIRREVWPCHVTDGSHDAAPVRTFAVILENG